MPVLRPRPNVHRFAPSCMHTRVHTTYIHTEYVLVIVSVLPEVQGFDLTEYGYFYSVNVEYRDYRY